MDTSGYEGGPVPVQQPNRKLRKLKLMMGASFARQKVENRKAQRQWRKDLARNITGLRVSCKLTVEQLARELCWSAADVHKLESGGLTPSAGQHADLARWTQAAKPRR